MPKVAVASLKRENDSLKEEIATLRHGFDNLQISLTRNDAEKSSNGGEPSFSITNEEALSALQLYGKFYDDLRSEADKSLQQLWSHLKALTSQMDEVGNAIDEIQRCSYQYNVKIVGLPEIDSRESASATTSLCIRLLKASGVDINKQDVDIAHRAPTRQATTGPRPVICKFTRRIVKEELINQRKEACKVSATSIGLSAECSLEDKLLLVRDRLFANSLEESSKKNLSIKGRKFARFLQHRLVYQPNALWKMSRFSITSLRRPRNFSPMPRNFKFEMVTGSAGQKTLLYICGNLRTPVPSGSNAMKTLINLHAKRTCL